MVGRHGEGGGEDSESRVRRLNICFIPVEFFIVSQGCCESRGIIYNPRANSVLSVFIF